MGQQMSWEEEDVFDDSCSWPRRLLHVESWTSYPWKQGNRYRGVYKPKYVALSYTWGRWRLKEGVQESVEALNIRNVPWKIPRVDPQHFTVDEFQNAIIAAANGDSGDRKQPKVKFVWLDVACIDQEDEDIKHAEVSRQFTIFNGAQRCAIWLASTSPIFAKIGICDFLSMRSPFTSVYMNMTSPGTDGDDIAKHMMIGYSEMLLASTTTMIEDPWFTSLWTLQETFISRDQSVFLCNNGEIVKDHRGEVIGMVDLMETSYSIFNYLSSQLHLMEGYQDVHALIKDTISHIERLGFRQCFVFQEMGAYFAARHRKASRSKDRIYGIMQIFDIKVGQQNDLPQNGSQETLELLEDGLGAALNLQNPVRSQLHVFTQPAPLGKAWRPWQDRCDVIRGYEFIDIMGPTDDYTVKISTRVVDGMTFGYFQGVVCGFKALHDATTVLGFLELHMDSLYTDDPSLGDASIAPAQVCDTQFYTDEAAVRAGHYKRSARVLKEFQSKGLCVLRLGPTVENVFWGMLIVPNKIKNITYWQRVGICQWLGTYSGRSDQSGMGLISAQDHQSYRDCVNCKGSVWYGLEGIFG